MSRLSFTVLVAAALLPRAAFGALPPSGSSAAVSAADAATANAAPAARSPSPPEAAPSPSSRTVPHTNSADTAPAIDPAAPATAPALPARTAAPPPAETGGTLRTQPATKSPSPPPAPGMPPAQGRISEPAPRPATEVRIQNRYAAKANLMQVFGGVELLERGDFFNSPGVRIGVTYWTREWLGYELQLTRYFSWLTAEAENVRKTLGAIPDSHAPEWLFLVGARASLGYGKMLLSGTQKVIHFEPQAFLHAGVHIYDGDIGPSARGGVGFLFFLSPRWFARVDLAVTWEMEKRSGDAVHIFGVVPSLVVGGVR